MTRLAILSDIHGNLPALEAVIADARAQGCTGFVNLGDTLSGPLWPAETADFLMARDWPTIAGNHERQVLTLPRDRMGASDIFAREQLNERQLAWLAAQPATCELTPDIFLCHGTPASDLTHYLFTVEPAGIRDATDAEVQDRTGDRPEPLILCGHSHIPGERVLADGRRVANPGSVGLQAFHDDHPNTYTVENGDPRARYAIVENGAVTFHQVDYDHLAAAAKADRDGRPDWALGLRTGRMEQPA
ncbi:MAG TPA: metallophosphoesterase family protein [Sphingomonas sp.]|uniref:metallophosphoesterase family protein n=1 Tax=Sphingomonas sp. TaxID=28214 RepID=UPI002BEFE147|nr:metallophosphoesterase family protein [Sphingomonas sp.]HMI20528.1 metallophosphoesterase family protein [Sphingomonas sp.]